MLALTDEQKSCVGAFENGKNVCIRAIPGGGKTALLISSCMVSPKPCLLLAYNTKLALEMNAELVKHNLKDDVVCLTFHALCSRCFSNVRDDVSLLEVVERAERGDIEQREALSVKCVLIDECQDVRQLYVRLLKAIGLVGRVPFMCVGDENQLIYDFDPDFPSDLSTLMNPTFVFGGEWEHKVLSQTHRLTNSVAMLVSKAFGITINAYRVGPPIVIRMCKPFNIYNAVSDLFENINLDETMLLVHRRKGNLPLKMLLNELSSRGMKLRVHGIDGDEGDDAQRNDVLECHTWWSCKGAQCKTAFVIVPKSGPKNPMYVALTRAYEQLVLIMDDGEPCATLCQAVSSLTPNPDFQVQCDQRTMYMIERTAIDMKDVDSFVDNHSKGRKMVREGEEELPRMVSSGWRSSRSLTSSSMRVEHASITAEDPIEKSSFTISCSDGVTMDVSKAVQRMLLIRCEMEALGRIRFMVDIQFPNRTDYESALKAQSLGLSTRRVSKFASDDELLSSELKEVAVQAYSSSMASWETYAEIALASLAWSEFHYVMRQMRPVGAWCNHEEVDPSWKFLKVVLPREKTGDVEYDVLLRRVVSGKTLMYRVHAMDSSQSYHVTWGEDETMPSHETMTCALVSAAFHTMNKCLLVDPVNRWIKEVTCTSPENVMRAIQEE